MSARSAHTAAVAGLAVVFVYQGLVLKAMPAINIGVAKLDRGQLTESFNPVTLGAAVIALAAVALLTDE